MSEKRDEAKSFSVAGKPHDHRDNQNTDLLNEIIELMDSGSDEDMDVDTIMRDLALLQEKAPVPMDHTPEGLWEKMVQQHPLIFEVEEEAGQLEGRNQTAANSPSRKKRSAYFFGSLVAAMLCLVVTANAFGVNPVRVLLDWAEGIIQIYNNPSGNMELPPDDPSEYHSLEEALSSIGLDENRCPNWVPKDYQLSMVDVWSSGNIFQCSATYESTNRGELVIRVTHYSNIYWSETVEREDGGREYKKDGIDYYLVTNSNQGKAGWQDGPDSYVISGQVTEQELIEMIDSITIRR